MSLYYNDYIISSNNSINDNKYNAEKAAKSSSRKIKQILKPLLRMLRQSKRTAAKSTNKYEHPKNTSIESYDDFWSSSEVEDNSANEELESRIMTEIEQCPNNAAIYVYENNVSELQPVFRKQQFVPVHFARTEAGTFFWTTVQRAADSDLLEPSFCSSGYQVPQLQTDRWVQA
jgi:Enhancer of split M4 family